MSGTTSYARSCKQALIEDLKQNPDRTYMQIADDVFVLHYEPKTRMFVLTYTDTWTGRQQTTLFSTEVDATRFMGEILTESDGPAEEFIKRFPESFNDYKD